MNDLIVQVIYLPVTLVMASLEVLGKAVAALRAPAANGSGTTQGTAPVSSPIAAPVATARTPRSGSASAQSGATVTPVSYHPNALKKAPAAS